MCGTTVSAPSASLLRFLRSQAQEISFFNPTIGLDFFQHSLESGRTRSRRKDGGGIGSYPKDFTTSRRRQATCEASIVNLDFLTNGLTRHAQSPSAVWPRGGQSSVTCCAGYFNGHRSRHASSLFRPLLERLWGSRQRNGKAALKHDDLPEFNSFLDDANGALLGRSKVGKAANEMKLRCTELNENGAVTLVNGEFKKSELIAKACLSDAAPRCRTRADEFFSMAFSPEISGKSTPPRCHTFWSALPRSSSIYSTYEFLSSTIGFCFWMPMGPAIRVHSQGLYMIWKASWDRKICHDKPVAYLMSSAH